MSEYTFHRRETFSGLLEENLCDTMHDLFYSSQRQQVIRAWREWASRDVLLSFYDARDRLEVRRHTFLPVHGNPVRILKMRILGEWGDDLCVHTEETAECRSLHAVFHGRDKFELPEGFYHAELHPHGNLVMLAQGASGVADVYVHRDGTSLDLRKPHATIQKKFERVYFVGSGIDQMVYATESCAWFAEISPLNILGMPVYSLSEPGVVWVVKHTGEVWRLYGCRGSVEAEDTGHFIPRYQQYHSRLTFLPGHGLCFVEETVKGFAWRFGDVLHPAFDYVTDLVLTPDDPHGHYFASRRDACDNLRLYRMNIG